MYKEKLRKAINNASSELTAGHVTIDEVDFFVDILEEGGFTIVRKDLLDQMKLTRDLQQKYFSLRKGAGRYPSKEARIVLDESKSVEIELDELLKEWNDENGFGELRFNDAAAEILAKVPKQDTKDGNLKH